MVLVLLMLLMLLMLLRNCVTTMLCPALRRCLREKTQLPQALARAHRGLASPLCGGGAVEHALAARAVTSAATMGTNAARRMCGLLALRQLHRTLSPVGGWLVRGRNGPEQHLYLAPLLYFHVISARRATD